MNKPQPYPEFVVSVQVDKEDVPNTTPKPFQKFPKDLRIPVQPPFPQYISNDYEHNFQPGIYQEDPNKQNFPPEIFQKDPKKQNLPNFPPRIYQQDTNQKPKPLKLRYVPPSAGRIKNPPKYKILPLQMYNKVIVSPVAPPPPPPINNKQILQQWTSCICVPSYLCKDGVLNSGGRLREFRSFAYSIGNKVSTRIFWNSLFKSNFLSKFLFVWEIMLM